MEQTENAVVKWETLSAEIQQQVIQQVTRLLLAALKEMSDEESS